MAEVQWIKVRVDIFDNDKIKIILAMDQGHTLFVLWHRLMTQAGKTNDDGAIYLTESVPFTPEMLSIAWNMSRDIIVTGLDIFQKFGMIEIYDRGFIQIANWSEHQSVDELAKIKEQNRERKRKQREKQKQKKNKKNPDDGEGHGTGHGTVTGGHATDKELELEKELDDKLKQKVQQIRFHLSSSVYEPFLKGRTIDFTIDDQLVLARLLKSGISPDTITEGIVKTFAATKEEKISSVNYFLPEIEKMHTDLLTTGADPETWRVLKTNKGD